MTERRIFEIIAWVKTQVSPRRFRHIQGVAKTAEKLATRFQIPVSKARTAAWLHDCGKELSRLEMKRWLRKSRIKLDSMEKIMPGLWHPHVGATIAERKWGITETSILEAIRCHTLGNPQMGPLAQLIFVADFIEPGRKFSGIGLARKLSSRNLSQGVVTKASMTIEFLFQKKMKIHPRLLETWNYFLNRVNNEKR